MDTQPTPAPTQYGARPPAAVPARVRTAYRIAAWLVLGLSTLALVGVVALSVYAATDPGEYSSLGFLFALFLLVPVLVALTLLGVAHWLRHRKPVASLVLVCLAAVIMIWLAGNALPFVLPM